MNLRCIVLVALAGCTSPYEVARDVCGSALEAKVDSGASTLYAGCRWVVKGHSGVRARVGRRRETGDLVSLEVSLYGDSKAEPAMRRRAAALAGQVLDGQGQAALERALEQLGTNESRLETVGSYAIGTGVLMARTNVPWERMVTAEVWFDPKAAEKPSFTGGLGPGFATLTPETLATWERLCRDDAWIGPLVGGRAKPAGPESDGGEPGFETRWATGNHWLRCQAFGEERTMVTVTGVWKPATRELVELEIVAKPPALGAIAEQLVAPLLGDEARAQLRGTIAGDPVSPYEPLGIRLDEGLLEISGGLGP